MKNTISQSNFGLLASLFILHWLVKFVQHGNIDIVNSLKEEEN